MPSMMRFWMILLEEIPPEAGIREAICFMKREYSSSVGKTISLP